MQSAIGRRRQVNPDRGFPTNGREKLGAIVDVLHLGIGDLELIKRQYPDCSVTNETRSHHSVQRYRVIIPSEDEENYYLFLVQNTIAACSTNFLSRAQSDNKFAERMKARITRYLETCEGGQSRQL